MVAASRLVLEKPRVVLHIHPDPSTMPTPPPIVEEPLTFWQKLFGKRKKKSADPAPATEEGA